MSINNNNDNDIIHNQYHNNTNFIDNYLNKCLLNFDQQKSMEINNKKILT